MATRARASKAAGQQHYVPSDDSDDEAPEVVPKASAEEQARDQRRLEHEAQAAASAKRKRKVRAEPVVESHEPIEQDDDAEVEEAPELPADVLSAIATRDEEDRTEQELEQAHEERRRKREAAAKKRTHIRDFGSVQVQTLEALDAAEARKLTEAATAFLDRKAAPHRARMDVLEGHASQFTKKQKRRV